MTVLPEPVPLELPPGNPAALADLLDAATQAAFRLGVLAAHLAGPAGQAPGWLGADAAAAAHQLTVVADLTVQLHDGVTGALRRLAQHHELLVETRARVRALRAAQDDDVARATVTLTTAADDGAQLAAVRQLLEAEAARRRVHAAMLAEVEEDAAATAAVLAHSTAPVAGRARRGDGDRVTAQLAAVLPGWGEPELAALGRAAGLAVRGSSDDDIAPLLARDDYLVGNPTYAAAWLAAAGPRRFVQVVSRLGEPGQPPELAVDLARLLAGAFRFAAASGPGQDPRLRSILDAPLEEPLDFSVAVGLGRVARAGHLPANYLARVASALARGERATPDFRRDQLSVAPGEDPLDAVLGGLARTSDAAVAARLLAAPTLWGHLLGRMWHAGYYGLDQLIRVAAESDLGAATTRVVLGAIGDVADVIITEAASGSAEGYALKALGPAIGALVAAHLPVVTDTIAVGLDGPARAWDADGRHLLAGLGLVTLDPDARVAVLQSLVHATTQAIPEVGPGARSVAAYAHGGVFAVMAFGEAQDIRRQIFTDIAVADAEKLWWNVITAPLGAIPPQGKVGMAVLTGSTAFFGPGDLPLGDFLREPATGDRQATFSAVVAAMPTLVDRGLLPDPGHSLDRGLASDEAATYQRGLTGPQIEVWDDVYQGAQRGYLEVGDALGFLPGADRPDGEVPRIPPSADRPATD